jgi:hypothetical protein
LDVTGDLALPPDREHGQQQHAGKEDGGDDHDAGGDLFPDRGRATAEDFEKGLLPIGGGGDAEWGGMGRKDVQNGHRLVRRKARERL